MNFKRKLSIGYFLPEKYSICECLEHYGEYIGEVYFPVKGIANGRGISIFDANDEKEMLEELKIIEAAGIKLNLLLNANCYGGESLSKKFGKQIKTAVEKACEFIELNIVTASSLFVASVIKENFNKLEVRASVNMNIGSVNEVRYVEDYFDSFCVARNLNRKMDELQTVSNYIHSKGKKISILANSGCLLNCPAHTFHDNLVSHENELVMHENLMAFKGVCWDFYAKNCTSKDFIENSTWITPEQISLYSNMVDYIKLATRVHKNPGKVIEAYVDQQYDGNVLGLMEPDFSSYHTIKTKDVLV